MYACMFGGEWTRNYPDQIAPMSASYTLPPFRPTFNARQSVAYLNFLKKTQNADDNFEIVSLNLPCKGCVINRLFCALVLAGVMRRKSIYWQHLIQITAPALAKYKN